MLQDLINILAEAEAKPGRPMVIALDNDHNRHSVLAKLWHHKTTLLLIPDELLLIRIQELWLRNTYYPLCGKHGENPRLRAVAGMKAPTPRGVPITTIVELQQAAEQSRHFRVVHPAKNKLLPAVLPHISQTSLAFSLPSQLVKDVSEAKAAELRSL